MAYLATNNAKSTLQVSLGGTVGDTTLQIQTADIGLFPVVNNGGVGADYTLLTLFNAAGNKEIVRVNRHDSGSSSFTIVRGQEGTTVRSWDSGDGVSLRLTAGVVQQTYTHPSQATGAHAASAIAVTPTGGIAATDVQAALAELDAEKATAGHSHSAISVTVTPTGGIGSSNVQDALAELDTEKAATGHVHVASSVTVTPTGGIAATDVQAALAELDGEKLGASAIGSTVQAYDVDTAKLDVAQTWVATQRTNETTDNDGSFDLNAALDFKCTPTAGFTLTFTNIPATPLVQKGTIILVNSGGYAVAAHANTKVGSSLLAAISATGTYQLAYRTSNGVVYVTASGALA